MIELSEYHQGFIAGYMPGFLMGLGLTKMAWDHEDRQRRRRRRTIDLTIASSGSGYRPIPGVEPPKPEFPPPREIPADWP